MAFSYPSMKGLLLFHLLSVILLTSPIDCNKVSLGLYYESLCPYSANFIIDSLDGIFSNGLIDIVDLKLVPWGNTKIYGTHTFKCQHGSWECVLNAVESCAIDAWPDVNDHFPFIYCVERLVYQKNYTYWETCFDKLGLNATSVKDCYNSDRATQLELGYAAETNALQPPHQYVPWVVVDGKPLYDDYEDFASYICKAYKGTAKPSACTDSLYGLIPKVKLNFLKPVFGKETTKSIQDLLSWLL